MNNIICFEQLESRLLLSGSFYMEGDATEDNFVGGEDLNVVLSNWGQEVTVGDFSSGDFNINGFVDGEDLNVVLKNWGNGYGFLNINFTDDIDVIDIFSSENNIILNFNNEEFLFGKNLSYIYIKTYDGNDIITIDHNVDIDIIADGGSGNDKIFINGTGNDVLIGGDGEDLLVSIGGGSDSLYGNKIDNIVDDDIDSYWLDFFDDTMQEAEDNENNNYSIHLINTFQSYWTIDNTVWYRPSVEIDGQDLEDPVLTNDHLNAVYKDFSDNSLFSEETTIHDIDQGNIGDCYFVAALSSFTVSNDRIIYESITELGDGSYAIRFYRYGTSVRYMRIDGDLPVATASSSAPIYAGLGVDGCLWVPLLEKAFAQFRASSALNSYQNLIAGDVTEGYKALYKSTSLEAFNYHLASYLDTETLYNLLLNHLNDYNVIAASSQTNETPIYASHAYSIVDVSFENEEYYVTIYNPWGYDGKVYDDNYNDGLLKITIDFLKINFAYLNILDVNIF